MIAHSKYSQPKHLIIILISMVLMQAASIQADEIDFENDVLPILENSCLYCHGEDEQESGLRLDLRSKMLKGGDSGLSAVVPGKPEKSYLIEVINHVDEEMAMPPDDDKLPDEEIQLLTRWIEQGAVVPGQMDVVDVETSDHWSFQPVVRPEVPSIDAKTVGPVDAFLQAKLASSDLTFSPAADPRMLIRRASIVLTGIAATPDDTDAFVKEFATDSEKAYAGLVDRLLASPHFGERWAQHWLDVIRWAETNGSEANLYRKNAWIYRDYVARAFNEDLPYDQFVRQQIAGDSMGMGEATGFLVAGPHVPAATVGREPSAIRQARADRLDEIIQTVGASVMGVTVGCARCHNHKFDPITITDYYSMTGVFQDIEFGSRYPEFSDDHPRKKSGKGIRNEIAKEQKLLRQFGGWQENWGAFSDMHFGKSVTTGSIRIRFDMKFLSLDELQIFGPENRRENLARSSGTKVTGFPEKGFGGGSPVTRLTDGNFGTMVWKARMQKGDEEKPWVRFDFDNKQSIDRLRLSTNREYFNDTDYLNKKPTLPKYIYEVEVKKDDGTWESLLNTQSVGSAINKKHPQRGAAIAKIQNLIGQLAQEGPQASFVGRFVDPVVTRVLHRGSPENPRDEVMPAGPIILGGDLNLTSDASGPTRRAEFAKWISSEENPLTARVMVNRVWHHIFGSGIAATTSDFGTAGSLPTHPELLDWLADEFVHPTDDSQPEAKKSWSVKSLIRLLVMSEAFRQSSEPTPQGIAVDAGTSLLWRFPPKRVEAEVIRDSILQASGTLDHTVGGRSYRIHNEKEVYAQWEVVKNFGPETWRRMLYQERMRRVDDQMFTAFDFPDCGQVRAKRPVSTTPLQALNLMNSQFVLSQSKLIAERATRESNGDLASAVDRCFELLLGRGPEEQERQDSLKLAQTTNLTLVCRVLINTNEFTFLP